MNSYPGVCVCVCVCVCHVVLSSPLLHVSLSPLCVQCVCLSHPSRAVHLYLSETSIEIDSSDGMISEASTKDPSSSEDEGPSSDDDDGGDDSDWLGGDRHRDRNADVKASQEACWRDAQVAPMDGGSWFCRVVTRWRERRCGKKKVHVARDWKERGKKALRDERLEIAF